MKTRLLMLIFLISAAVFNSCNTPTTKSSDSISATDPISLMYEDEDKVIPYIRDYVDQIESGTPLEINGAKIFSQKVLPDFYKNRNYRPAWADTLNLIDAVNFIKGSVNEGLIPEDYHYDALQQIWDELKVIHDTTELDFQWVAQFDILFTDAMMLYGFHLLEGKVDPETLDVSWNYGFLEIPGDVMEEFSDALVHNTLPDLVQKLRPQTKGYPLLMQELALLNSIAENGGWDSIPDVTKIEPGDSSELIPLVRKRLFITNDISDTLNKVSYHYDSLLANDIIVYQQRHGIVADGIIGQGTIDVLNVPVEAKIDQIRANLERHRWVAHNLSGDFIIVNIAGFELWVYQNHEMIFETQVVVGKTYHKTPVFKSRLQYIEFNPTWTIPRSITIKETLPKIKKDPNYLSRYNMVLLDHNGNIVSPEGIDFSQYSGSNFPYVVRQQAGQGNALGDVKFIFPNEYSVYLHDTPSKSLFAKTSKAFSHGCIRVQYPLDLAAVLLDGTEWTPHKIDQTISTRKTTRVNLNEPMDVMLLYWTVGPDDSGNIVYSPDIYERDQAIIDHLNERFTYGPEYSKKYLGE